MRLKRDIERFQRGEAHHAIWGVDIRQQLIDRLLGLAGAVVERGADIRHCLSEQVLPSRYDWFALTQHPLLIVR